MAEKSELNSKMVVGEVGSVLKTSAEIGFKSFVRILSGDSNQAAGPKRMSHADSCVANTVKELGGIAIKVLIKKDGAEARALKTYFIGNTIKSLCRFRIDRSFVLMRVENNFTKTVMILANASEHSSREISV